MDLTSRKGTERRGLGFNESETFLDILKDKRERGKKMSEGIEVQGDFLSAATEMINRWIAEGKNPQAEMAKMIQAEKDKQKEARRQAAEAKKGNTREARKLAKLLAKLAGKTTELAPRLTTEEKTAKVMEALESGKSLAVSDIATASGLGVSTANQTLKTLADSGKVKKTETTNAKGRIKYLFSLALKPHGKPKK